MVDVVCYCRIIDCDKPQASLSRPRWYGGSWNFCLNEKKERESTERKLTGKKLIWSQIKDENFLSKIRNSPLYLIHEFSRQKSIDYLPLISETRRGDRRVCGCLKSRAIQIEAALHQMLRNLSLSRVPWSLLIYLITIVWLQSRFQRHLCKLACKPIKAWKPV